MIVRRSLRAGRTGAAWAAVFAVTVIVTTGWIERRPIVTHFVGETLARDRVAARYRLTRIGPFEERLDDLSIGDPLHPDLTARSVTLHLGYGLHGVRLRAVEAVGIRLRARWRDGLVSLGKIDRLLPTTGNGAPFVLPDIMVSLTDSRLRLDTPAGAIGGAISGHGNLANGFSGRIDLAAPRLTPMGCAVAGLRAALMVETVDRRTRLSGPLHLDAAGCSGRGAALGAGKVTLDVTLGAALKTWRGKIAAAGFAGRAGNLHFTALRVTLSGSGGIERTTGDAAIRIMGATAPQGGAAAIALAGRYVLAPRRERLSFSGDAMFDRGALARADAAGLTRSADRIPAPLAPIARLIAGSAAAMLRDVSAHAPIVVSASRADGIAANTLRLAISSASGARMRFGGGAGIGWNSRSGAWRADGHVTLAGGGLPTIDAVIRQPAAGGAVDGVATIAPYDAGAARVALTPIRFAVSAAGNTWIDTIASLDGRLGSVRITGLRVPLTIKRRGGGLVVDPGCIDSGFDHLTSGSLSLAAPHLRLCGTAGDALFRRRPDGTSRYGATLAGALLTGRSGAQPLRVSAAHAALSGAAVALSGVSVRLGADAPQTALDVAGIVGSAAEGGFTGRFTGAGGRIGAVPLLLSDAAGTWRIADGALTLSGAMTVADAQATNPRFHPLAARDVTLRLANGRIEASGTLHEPETGTLVSRVTLRHDLATSSGDASLDVPGLVFDKALQPEMLAPLTLGVIANVAGTISGGGRIDWTPAGVTSGGSFHSDRIDLAAAFGPVSGIAGTIRFSDLLGLVTPPHQHATIAQINPGVAVTNGVVDYQLIGNQQIRVEGARWPFAGGTLSLDPTLLTFGEQAKRHLTFTVRGLNAAAFVQQFDLPNISATGTFDGRLPMIFDQSGGRIVGGDLTVRPGGGTLAYLGTLSNAQLGTMGKLAFDALKAIRYTALTISLDGRLDGEIISRIRFDGVHQATGDNGIVARAIRGLPFRFNITIHAPFRGLLGSARGFADPGTLLPAANTVDIQPAESETVR